MKKIASVVCCVLVLISIAFASDYADYDLEENYNSSYNDGYYQGYRDGFSADRSTPNNDIIDRSELNRKTTWDDERTSSTSVAKSTENSLVKYYPYIIVILIILCVFFCVLLYKISSNYRKVTESIYKHKRVLFEIAQKIKNNPEKSITEDEINEILRKNQ